MSKENVYDVHYHAARDHSNTSYPDWIESMFFSPSLLNNCFNSATKELYFLKYSTRDFQAFESLSHMDQKLVSHSIVALYINLSHECIDQRHSTIVVDVWCFIGI